MSDFTKQVDQAIGELCVAIGGGEFREAVAKILRESLQVGFDRGVAWAKKVAEAAKEVQRESQITRS